MWLSYEYLHTYAHRLDVWPWGGCPDIENGYPTNLIL